MQMGDRWISVAETAAYFSMNRDTLNQWIGRRKLPAQEVGRLWKFKVSEVDAWVQSGRAAAKPARAKTGKAAQKDEG